jgi:hypothetical protein
MVMGKARRNFRIDPRRRAGGGTALVEAEGTLQSEKSNNLSAIHAQY